MHRPAPSPTTRPASRSGFSLIELMIVMIIIAILAGLLFPAINGARLAAREAQVVNEIKGLEKAIADFKLKYGVEPPSRLRLHETGTGAMTGWNSPDIETRNTVAFFRQIWPNANFTRFADPTFIGNVDFNGNGDPTDPNPIDLVGAECLVFLLGGMFATANANDEVIVSQTGPVTPQPSDTTPAKWSTIGFSTNPRNPFAYGGTRVGPFFEFDSARLQDFNNNGMPEYLDTLPGQTMPYLYASSYEGRGYTQRLPPPTPPPPRSNPDLDNPQVAEFWTYYNSTQVPYNQKGFQIISPGVDGEYGTGGLYDGEKVPSDRSSERDNITNFKSGRLN